MRNSNLARTIKRTLKLSLARCKDLGSRITLKRIDKRIIPKDNDEIRLFASCRNEADILPQFLEYYRKLGVDRFFFIDNGSSDESAKIILKEKNAHLFRTHESFSRKESWMQHLLNKYGNNHWCLTVDLDEFLIYLNAESVNLKTLCKFLDQEGSTCIKSLLIDMYGKGPLLQTQNAPSHNLFKDFPYYDQSGYSNKRKYTSGGPRARVFKIHPCLDKFPLLKHHKGKLKIGLGYHNLSGAKVSTLTAGLLHFKYTSNFYKKSLEESKREKHHPKYVHEYQTYYRCLTEAPETSFWNLHSGYFKGSSSLIESGLLKTSGAFNEFVTSCHNQQGRHTAQKTMHKPLISIIIINRDKAKWLKASINSCLSQTYSNKEIIIVDDASTDKSKEIIAGYGSKVRVSYEKSSRGPGFARNIGLQLAKGELIQFLDSDDFIAPKKLDLQANSILKNSGDLCVSSFRKVFTFASLNFFYPVISSERDFLATTIEDRNPHPLMSFLFKKSFLESVGLWREDLEFHEDRDYQVRIWDASPSVSRTEHCLFYYRRYAGLTRTNSFRDHPELQKKRILSSIEFIKTISGRHCPLVTSSIYFSEIRYFLNTLRRSITQSTLPEFERKELLMEVSQIPFDDLVSSHKQSLRLDGASNVLCRFLYALLRKSVRANKSQVSNNICCWLRAWVKHINRETLTCD